MQLKQIVNTFFASNTYVLSREGRAWLVDCGDAGPVIDYLHQNSLSLQAILLTHCHFDHIYGLNEVVAACPDCRVFASDLTIPKLRDPRLNYSRYNLADYVFEGQAEPLASTEKSSSLVTHNTSLPDGPVHHSSLATHNSSLPDGPVHHSSLVTHNSSLPVEVVMTPGHDDGCASFIIDRYIFTGDSLIPGVKTVTNLRGNKAQAAQSEALLRDLIHARHLTICPGHGPITSDF